MRVNLKCLRIKHKLNQGEIARILNVSRGQYLAIENGKSNGSMNFWQAIQKVFGVPDSEMWELMKCE